jgi:hypothetical protein
MKKTYDIDFSTEVESRHPMIARPYSGGRLKALFVPSVYFGREIVELIQRTDMDYETVTIDRAWDLNKWGLGDFYDLRGGIWDFEIVYKNLENILTSDEKFDVLVLPGINGWDCFTEKTREAILRRVEEGTGLVLLKPYNSTEVDKFDLVKELSPLQPLFNEGLTQKGGPKIAFDKLQKDMWIQSEHYITRGIPFDIFPYDEMAYYPYESSGDVIIRSESGMPIAAVKEYGKSRIVAFGYFSRDILPQHNQFPGSSSCFDSVTARWKGIRHKLPFNYLEYFYSLIYRSMLWAAKKEPVCSIAKVLHEENKVAVRLTSEGNYTLNAAVRNLYDQVVFETETQSREIILPADLKLGGEYRVDLSLKNKTGTVDWATAVIKHPLSAQIKDISINCDTAIAGDVVSAAVNVSGRNAELEVKVIDDFNRVLYTFSKTIDGNNTVKFDYTVPKLRSLHLKVQADISVQGHLVHRQVSPGILVTPTERKIKDFEVFMTAMNRGQGDLLEAEAKRLHDMGITMSFVGDNKLSTSSGAEGLGIYWYNRGPYAERKEQYLRTKDKKYLHRVPCLNDPEFLEENRKSITGTVKESRKFGPVTYFANDEGSITCYTDELDLCFCPHCMSKMREWLKGEYESIEQLNKIWDTNFTKWEEVVPLTSEEARKTGKYASWGDHRRFMELSFANAYKAIGGFIKEEDPEGIIRMSGCQATTAYSGYDYYNLHRFIGCFEAYPAGNQYEYHRSFARPGTVLGGWFGYGARGVPVQNRIWYGIYHGLTLISIFWEFGTINPDFSFSSSAADMSKIFKEIKGEGIGKLLLHSASKDSLGIAVHYSMPSVHGTYIRGAQTAFEGNRDGWLSLLEDMGYQYNFVAAQQIEAGELLEKGYKLLILPYSIALSSKETEEIKRFAEKGGVVIGDLQTGIMDEHCKLYDTGRLDDLFGIERLNTDTGHFYGCGGNFPNREFPYFSQPKQKNIGIPKAEPGIRTTTGKAAYTDDFMRTIASVVVNEYGKGKGVYLNCAMNSYPSALKKKKDGGAALKDIIGKIADMAGIRRFAVLNTPDGISPKGYEMFYYKENSAKYVGILKEIEMGTDFGHDGLSVGTGREVTRTVDAIDVNLDEKSHVYDVRAKKYLGYHDRIDTSIASGDTVLLSLLPYKVNSIEIGLDARIVRGSELKANIRVDSEKPEGEYATVLNIKLYNPSGEYEWIYLDNTSIRGNEYCYSQFIPFNEKAGTWKIVAKDVASGVAAEKSFEII